MSGKSVFAIGFILAAVFLGSTTAMTENSPVPRMTIEELKGMLGDPQVVVLDVRSKYDFDDSRSMIKGAVREDPARIDWAQKYPKDKTLVLYCT